MLPVGGGGGSHHFFESRKLNVLYSEYLNVFAGRYRSGVCIIMGGGPWALARWYLLKVLGEVQVLQNRRAWNVEATGRATSTVPQTEKDMRERTF